MQISKLKELSEFVSVIAVIITLMFLIFEVRENTAAVRTDSYGDSITRLNNWRLQMASDKELSDMFAMYISGELPEFSRAEGQQFQFIYGSLWSIYESAYFAMNYGTLGESEWSRFEQMICNQYEITVLHGYWGQLENLLSSEFRNFTQEQCR